jgi:hypothetical protein
MNTVDIIFYIIDISLIGLIILLFFIFFSRRKPKKKNDKEIENKEIEKKEYKIILDNTGKMNLEEILKESVKVPSENSSSPKHEVSESFAKDSPADILNMNQLQTELKKADDENYEKMVKVSAYEISHAHEIDKQQLQIQEEREKRRRLIS